MKNSNGVCSSGRWRPSEPRLRVCEGRLTRHPRARLLVLAATASRQLRGRRWASSIPRWFHGSPRLDGLASSYAVAKSRIQLIQWYYTSDVVCWHVTSLCDLCPIVHVGKDVRSVVSLQKYLDWNPFCHLLITVCFYLSEIIYCWNTIVLL